MRMDFITPKERLNFRRFTFDNIIYFLIVLTIVMGGFYV